MKVAVIGSRHLNVNNLQVYLPEFTTEIVSGGARGIDSCARVYAVNNHIKLTEFLPDYKKYGKSAPLVRNIEIIKYSDIIVAFWDGKSRGKKYVIENSRELNKQCRVYFFEQGIFYLDDSI